MMLEKTIAIAVLLAASQVFAQDANWERLRDLKPGERVEIGTRDGTFLSGQFTRWTPGSIELLRKQSTLTLKPENVERVTVRRKGSRPKAALWGTLIGFGVAFPFGAAWAGHVTDRNNPGFATRAGMGAGFGMFGAGAGAGIGALAGGKQTVTIYRAARRP